MFTFNALASKITFSDVTQWIWDMVLLAYANWMIVMGVAAVLTFAYFFKPQRR